MRTRFAVLLCLLISPQLAAGEASVFVASTWGDKGPACPPSLECRLELGSAARDAAGLLAPMLHRPELQGLASSDARAGDWAAVKGVLAWREGGVVVLSITPRPGDAAMGVEGLNRRFADELSLLASGDRDAMPSDASLILSPRGPVRAPVDLKEVSEEELETLLVGLDARMLVVGAPEGEPTRLARGKRVLFVGREAVELAPDGAILLRDAGGSRVLVPSDAVIEEALAMGRIVEERPVGEGITRPWRLTLEHGGRRFDAIFKTVEKRHAGPSKERNFATEPFFIDSYRFERAAYLFDRVLGLGLVPVTVLRQVGGAEGSLTVFVEGAVQHAVWEAEHAAERPSARLDGQLEKMRLLDALILNTDRNGFNLLVGTEDLSLHAIDHSRSFRFAPTLESALRARPPRAPEDVYRRLAALDATELHELLDPLVGRQRVNALLKRRDKLLEARREHAK